MMMNPYLLYCTVCLKKIPAANTYLVLRGIKMLLFYVSLSQGTFHAVCNTFSIVMQSCSYLRPAIKYVCVSDTEDRVTQIKPCGQLNTTQPLLHEHTVLFALFFGVEYC